MRRVAILALALPILVASQPTCPDCGVAAVIAAIEPDGAGYIVTLKVTNDGASTLPETRTDVYVDWPAPPLPGDLSDWFVEVPTMEPGKTLTFQVAVPGGERVDVKADSKDAIDEADEENNLDHADL